ADLGAALKGFKKAMGNDDAPPANTAAESTKVATEAKPPIEHKD
ncbi:TPA: twin-arginine translocase subunit TatA, partial [Yersinia enterocolitica]